MEKAKIGGVTKQTFMQADDHTKDGLLFDMLVDLKDSTCGKVDEVRDALSSCQAKRDETVGVFNERIGQVEEKQKKDRKKDAAIAGTTGIIGGFLAMLGKMIFWK